jgi:hypothetical protein
MILQMIFARKNRLVLFAVCAAILPAAPLWAQEPGVGTTEELWVTAAKEPEAPATEVMAVGRVSKQLLEDIISGKDVVAAIPFRARVVSFCFQGVIDGQGKLSMDMATAGGEATFVVYGRGGGHTYTRGVHWPLAVRAAACGPFVTRTLVRYDGRKFSRVETTPWVEAHVDLDRVEGIHGRLPGRVVGRLARPIAELLIPRAEAQASVVAEGYVRDYADGLADEIVGRINRAAPLEKSLSRLFPGSDDWIFQMSSDSRFLQAAFGPRGAAVPSLPENPGQHKDVRLELWLRSTTKEAKDLADLSNKPLARQLVRDYLITILPELTALSDEVYVDAAGQWLVISIGAPKGSDQR